MPLKQTYMRTWCRFVCYCEVDHTCCAWYLLECQYFKTACKRSGWP